MTRPIFKNEKTYNVSVPTPYGSSILVPPKHFIAGTFFNKFYAVNRELTLKEDTTVIPPGKLVCSFDVAAPVVPVATVINTAPLIEAKDLPVIVNNPSPVSEIVEEVKKNKGGRPRKSLEDATKDLWKDVTFVMPSSNEVATLSNDNLNKLATKLNVSKDLTRSELIEAVKSRLG